MQEKREWNQENVQDKNEELEPEETRLKDPGNNHGVLKGFLGGVLVTLCVLAIVLFVKSLEPKRLGTTPSQTPDHTAAGQQLDTEAIDLKLEKLKSLIDSKYMGDVEDVYKRQLPGTPSRIAYSQTPFRFSQCLRISCGRGCSGNGHSLSNFFPHLV